MRKPLVNSQFVAWSCKKFAQSTCKLSPLKDKESRAHNERDWRYIRYVIFTFTKYTDLIVCIHVNIDIIFCLFLRNNNMRKDSLEEQRRAVTSRVETQVFNTRSNSAPSLLQFNAYDHRIAVAAKDYLG